MDQVTRVINLRERGAFHVYVGRKPSAPNPRVPGADGRWGNPFKTGDREADVAAYKAQLWDRMRTRPGVFEAVAALKGKTLGCWCVPEACHGEVLAAAAEYAHARLAEMAAEAAKPAPKPRVRKPRVKKPVAA